MFSRGFKFKVFGFVLAVLLLGGIITGAKAQRDAKISVYCSRDRLHVTFTEWLPNESLTAFVDGSEVGQYTTLDDGSGEYIFPAGATSVALKRANGDAILAGKVDCSQPVSGEITGISQFSVTLPLGGHAQLSVTSKDDNGNEIELPIIWITEAGSFTADGEITATEEGEYLITAAYVVNNRSFAHIIPLTVTPPVETLKVEKDEIFVFAGQGYQIDVTALDKDGNPVEVMLEWEVGDAGEIVQPNIFVAGETAGDFEITGSIAGTDLSVDVLVHVIPLVERIQIEPKIDTLTVGETQEFHILAFNADGNEVQLPIPPRWSAEIGGINAQGVYTATAEGDETITAVLDLNEVMARRRGQGVLAGSIEPLRAELTFHITQGSTADLDEAARPRSFLATILLALLAFFGLFIFLYLKRKSSSE